MYGSGTVEVNLNGKPVDQTDVDACGETGFNISPKSPNTKHSIFELSFAASPGGFGVQLHDPGPRFGCDVLETEPATFIGELTLDGGVSVSTGDEALFTKMYDELPPLSYWDTTSATRTTRTATSTTTTNAPTEAPTKYPTAAPTKYPTAALNDGSASQPLVFLTGNVV